MASAPSYSLRAVSAFALMIGFYVLAFAIAGGLFALVYADVTMSSRVHVKVVVFGTIAALTILWSVLPRPGRFVAPGPRLARSQQPRLFKELEGVARAAGQAMPDEVYLVPDVNAWVGQRGGWMGFGGSRVMGLGLPLLQGLSRGQMRAVIAHEFGHYYGGDTRLGPVLYRTRSAIGRTVNGLGDSWLQLPFRWYAELFMRVSQAASRHQEFAADALAARLCGGGTMIGALEALPGLSQAFPAYWESEVGPTLQAGFLPPLANGFGRFIAHPDVVPHLQRVQESALGESVGHPHDTHPPLPERLAALANEAGAPSDPSDTVRAITLVEDVSALERSLLVHQYPDGNVGRLEAIGWDEVGDKVLLPRYLETVRNQEAVVHGLTTDALPVTVKELPALVGRLTLPAGRQVDAQAKETYALHILGSALSLALHGRGWVIHAGPGDPVTFRKSDQTLLPFRLLEQLRSDALSADPWRSLLSANDLVGLSLELPAAGVAAG